MMKKLAVDCALSVVLAIAGACLCGEPRSLPGKEAGPEGAVVGEVAKLVQPEIAKHLAEQEAKVRKELALALRAPAMLKLPVRLKCATDPWAAMADLEGHGLSIASAAGGKNVLPAVLDRLCASVGLTAGAAAGPKRPEAATREAQVQYVRAVLAAAEKLREEALAKMPAKTRGFMHGWPGAMIQTFGPQIALTDQTRALCQNDRAFCGLSRTQIDWAKLTASAKVLSALGDEAFLAGLATALKTAAPVKDKPKGVEGDLLHYSQGPGGAVVIGGPGANTYRIDSPVALIIDLGGDDTYAGAIAAGRDAEHANSVVIDVSGDDTYEGARLGLATGRLGVGLLIDRDGNDTYKLAQGAGGAGFAGIGILLDAAGDDVYTGSKFTQGVAFAGIGLLLDLGGDDRHTSFGYAVGFGGPGGVGAVIDVVGNDSYQCGRKYPSGYNGKNVKPDDPQFQYTAFGMGAGMGRRILSSRAQDHAFSLAGGLGVVIDRAGDDRYDSSNFSQGCGYFLGVGLKLD